MPLVFLTVGLAVAVSYVRGGRLRRLADAGLPWSWLLFLGLALQVVTDVGASRGLVGDGASYAVVATSQVVVLAWVLRNRSRPGMLLIGMGLLMNATVMAANGAMPVDPVAVERLGVGEVEVSPGKHELMTEDTRLPWLADVHPIAPIRTIVSLGDVVLAAGLLPLVHHLMAHRRPEDRPRRVRAAPQHHSA